MIKPRLRSKLDKAKLILNEDRVAVVEFISGATKNDENNKFS